MDLLWLVLITLEIDKMDFIEPLALETWITQVLAGTPDIFLAIALITIFTLAGFFRMNLLATFFMITVFMLMFSSFVSTPLLLLLLIIGGLLLGYSLSKIFGN